VHFIASWMEFWNSLGFWASWSRVIVESSLDEVLNAVLGRFCWFEILLSFSE
jgi:hypothetical protein